MYNDLTADGSTEIYNITEVDEMAKKYDLGMLEELGMTIDNLTDDDMLIIHDYPPHYILEPFHIVFYGDPEYEQGITMNEALQMLKEQESETV